MVDNFFKINKERILSDVKDLKLFLSRDQHLQKQNKKQL